MPYWGEFSPFPGTGNISEDPMFIDVANNDFRLKENSPCKNGADDGYNMGAYLGEWKPPPETDTTEKHELMQNIPNPFYTNTRIAFCIYTEIGSEDVTLKIYNISGQLIRTMISESKATGLYFVFWDGTDERGTSVNAGIYFYQLRVGDFVVTKKIIRLR